MRIKIKITHKTKSGNPFILEKDFNKEFESAEVIEQAKKHFAEIFGFKPQNYLFEIVTK